ncbi:family 20 glycosylhydrolase [Streptomyces sp. YC504]|uniref:Family 20 glycosylhydrolase n=1 Tax=Streptomyces mesophilus TaxID=1775132 RepID=A0A6G4XU05_9ACTN|nr:glycoside hydrolase family 20 protein [Streptomyces mesophilus]NGO80682.1 family 20 glycosylhydrolase [Streptomyces mesophilus]
MSRRPLLAAASLVAGAAAVLTVTLWPDGTPTGGTPSVSDRTDDRSPASSAPAYPLSKAPLTIPAVREHEAARGPGWHPDRGAQVIVPEESAGELADEGRLIADELGLEYAEGAEPGKGDVELALVAGDANPEAYTMSVSDERVRISATGEPGVFYGTRTLKQIVRHDGTAPEGVIRDAPAKPQRGFMLDIARKHFTAGWIEDRVRELADLKYNQLGLHFSDDQAFRIESSSHPEVVSVQHLKKSEVKRIIALARSLHIEVIPEIDSPGHLGAVMAAHPSLQLRDARGVPSRGAIDISKPGSAKIVDELLREYAGLFPGTYWHLGADEYRALMVANPEASYPQLAAAARAKFGPNAKVQDLTTGWLNDRAKVIRGEDEKPKVWNDGLFRGGVVQADKDLEVEYWTGKELRAREPVEYLKAGRKLVNLNDEYLYYVLGEPNTFKYPTGERIYKEWNPLVVRGSKPVPAAYGDQILGARFAVWCDFASAQTQDQVAAGIRMPLRATAQRVWDERQPALPWGKFVGLAQKVG